MSNDRKDEASKTNDSSNFNQKTKPEEKNEEGFRIIKNTTKIPFW